MKLKKLLGQTHKVKIVNEPIDVGVVSKPVLMTLAARQGERSEGA